MRFEAPAPSTAASGVQEGFTPRNVVVSLRRHAVLLVVVLVALPAFAIAWSLSAEKQYTATAKLLFRDPGFDQRLFGGQVLGPSPDPAREAATNVGLLSLDTVAERVARRISSRRLTPAQIRDKVDVAAQGQSNVVAVAATDASPRFAATLANTIADEYIVFRRNADRAKINESARLVQRQLGKLGPTQRSGTEGEALRTQLAQLRVLAALQTGNAERVQRAGTPASPSSPNVARNAILALLLAVAIGVSLALLLERLDTRLRHGEHAAALFGRPVLGTIAESPKLRDDKGEALHLGGLEAESFRTLRANLNYYDIDRDIRSLLITSADSGEGKSTVARYLAATAVAAGARVVLLEADLRHPTLSPLYPVLGGAGLSGVLTGQIPLDDAIQQLPVAVAGGSPDDKTLDVISAGSPPPNPTDLLESARMQSVLEDLGARYELVIVDTSPIALVADCIPVLGHVSGVLVVVREAKTTTVRAMKLRDQLSHLGIVPLGLVVNGAQLEADSYYEYYLPAVDASTPSDDRGRSRGRRRWLRPRHDERQAPATPRA